MENTVSYRLVTEIECIKSLYEIGEYEIMVCSIK